MDTKVVLFLVLLTFFVSIHASDVDKRLLLSDPTHFESELQQLKAKLAEHTQELAALKSKGNR